jgi:hypothetical protein
MEVPEFQTSKPEAPNRAQLNWPAVFVLLLLPAALAFTGALMNVDALAIACPLGGSLISALIFGDMIGRRFGKTLLARIVLGIACAAVFGCLALGLSFGGCALGGGLKFD